jgi:hypothetical protein
MSEIVPPLRLEKNENVGSPGRFSETIIPIAPAASARAAFVSYWQPPRATSAIAPRSDPVGSVASQSSRLTGCPFVPVIVPTSTRRWFVVVHPGGTLSVGTNAILPGETAGETMEIESPKTCAFETEPTLIASGAVPGDPTVPRPKKSRSFPADTMGTTPARATLAIAGISASVRGSDWGPPPEKLMMSIPSATAASNAATISGVVPEQHPPRGNGVLKTR